LSFYSSGITIFAKKNTLPQIPYINIHKHGEDFSEGEFSIRNIFAHNIPEAVEKWKGPLSAGIHPWHIDEKSIDEQLTLVKTASHHQNVIAIGEIGLDRLTSAPLLLQKDVFIKQLEIAATVNKPVIIHCVKAHSEIVSIVKKTGFKEKVVFHGFSQNRQIAEQLLKNGFYLSFGQALLNEKSNASKLFSEIPDSRFFLETDETDVKISEVYKKAEQRLS
jgi:TatD DNase family protein